MRASRIVHLLLVLQRQGRTSAAELAALLEVSERTIRRDVEALGQAGVPIYTIRGFGGGIEVLDGFATQLTGFTEEEAEALLLVGQPAVAHRLGLGAPTRSAGEKLLAAIGPGWSVHAERLASWFLHDPDPWPGHHIPHGELRRIARCVKECRTVELSLGRRAAVAVRPIGLVLKAGTWWLVHVKVDGTVSAINIDALRATRLTRERFERPRDFELGAFWAQRKAPKSQ
ncbi:MAG: helix-turn-helix transcriptional regulator [Acidimicrobiales bacterium]